MPLELQQMTFDNMRGVNTNKTLTQKSQYEAEEAMNGFLEVTGGFFKRNGSRRLNVTEIPGTGSVESVYQTLLNTGRTVLATRGTTLYKTLTTTFSSVAHVV